MTEEGAPRTGVRPARRGTRLLFAALAVLGPLLLVEVLSAVYLNFVGSSRRSLAERNRPAHVYEPYRNHALAPGWNDGGCVHDAQGFRRTEDVSIEKAPNGYRIFLMGGSAAYGLGAGPPFPRRVITNEHTIDHELEQLLEPRFPDLHVEVINAAVTAYWTHHHLIYLLETILDYHPDLIVFLDGINDYYHDRADHNQFLSYRYSLTLRMDELNHPGPGDAVFELLDWAKRWSNAAFVADAAAERLLGHHVAPPDPCQTEVVRPEEMNDAFLARYEAIARRSWVRTLRTILLLLRDQGVDAITSLQPELVFRQTDGTSPGDAGLREIETRQRPAYYAEKKEFLRPAVRRLAAETAEDLGATFVDLTDVFDDRDQYFIDYCHLSEAGSRRVAERLVPHVVRKIESRRAGQRTDERRSGAVG